MPLGSYVHAGLELSKPRKSGVQSTQQIGIHTLNPKRFCGLGYLAVEGFWGFQRILEGAEDLVSWL